MKLTWIAGLRWPRALFSQALAGEPELAEALPEPLARWRLRLCRHAGRRRRGPLHRGARRRCLETPLLGEGVDQKAGWGELLREVADAAAGELLARAGNKCRVESFEEIRRREPGYRAPFNSNPATGSWTILVRDETRA